MAQREVEVHLYSSKTSALEGDEWSAAHPAHLLPPGKTRYPLYRRLGGPRGQSGQAENLAPTGIRSPDFPARSQSLYRLSYPAHIAYIIPFLNCDVKNCVCSVSTDKLIDQFRIVG